MSIFNQILSAIDDPQKEANASQIGSILDTVQQLSGSNNASPDALQSAMSIVGSHTKSALKQQQNQGGAAQVNQLINQFGGTKANPQVLSTLFNSSQLQEMIQQISSRTGLNAKAIQSMLPILVPLVLGLLKTGNSKGNAQGNVQGNAQGNNSVASSFLDSDGDGDVDMGDAMKMAASYLGR